MLRRRFRLPLGGFRPKTTLSAPYFSIKFSENDLSYNRASVIISSKVEKAAARRNFYRRRLIEGIQTWPSRGLDFLIIAKPKIKELDPQSLKRELGDIYQKIK